MDYLTGGWVAGYVDVSPGERGSERYNGSRDRSLDELVEDKRKNDYCLFLSIHVFSSLPFCDIFFLFFPFSNLIWVPPLSFFSLQKLCLKNTRIAI